MGLESTVGWVFHLGAAALSSGKGNVGTFDSSSNRVVWNLPV